MEHKFLKYLYNSFAMLIEKQGFTKVNEVNDGQLYWIEYLSNTFGIKLEKYRREFDAILYKTGNPDRGINLFNLLRFLKIEFPQFKYSYGEFHNEKELEKYYKKQFNYISTAIYINIEALNDFFTTGNYESKVRDVEKFMLNEHPELFKKN